MVVAYGISLIQLSTSRIIPSKGERNVRNGQ